MEIGLYLEIPRILDETFSWSISMGKSTVFGKSIFLTKIKILCFPNV
jgi:hypothetical protein